MKKGKGQNKHVIFAEKSGNKKIGGKNHYVCATYVSIKATCPRSCLLYATKTCYAMNGKCNYHTAPLDRGVTHHDAYRVAVEEANAIDNAFGGRKLNNKYTRGRLLRLHVSGDCRSNKAAKVIAAAVDRWYERGGGTAWTYSHCWKRIDKASWGNISVLASVDHVKDARDAMTRGYVPARYVAKIPPKFGIYAREQKTAYTSWIEGGITWIPCQAQVVDGYNCYKCRLCLTDNLLKRKAGIAFEAHGTKENVLKRILEKGK